MSDNPSVTVATQTQTSSSKSNAHHTPITLTSSSAPLASSTTSSTVIPPLNHDLPPPPDRAVLLDQAANPLSILGLFEEATVGIWPKLVAGGLSCMLISAILNPMDVIKVRLQTQPKPVTADQPLQYQGFRHAFMKILKEEGYRRGLMRGFTPSMLREASYSSLRMGLYDMCKIMLAPPSTRKDEFTLGQKMLAGCISGGVGSVIATPTDLVKIRFQGYSLTHPNPYPHSFAAFSSIYSNSGFRGLYQGATPTIARAAILTGSQLSSYDHSKRLMLRSGMFQDTPMTHFIASVISGLVTTTACNPVDVIKTRIMMDGTKGLYANPIDCLVKTVTREGPAALSQIIRTHSHKDEVNPITYALVTVKGWVPNYLRLGPHFILSLPLAEYIRVRLGAESF